MKFSSDDDYEELIIYFRSWQDKLKRSEQRKAEEARQLEVSF